MSNVIITKDLFEKLEYDTNMTKENAMKDDLEHQVRCPHVMFVMSDSDLNAASYYLSRSLENRFDANAIVTVLVQESVLEAFTAKVQDKLVVYPAPTSPNKNDLKRQKNIKRLYAKTIRPKQTTEEVLIVGPTIVCDFTHEQLGVDTASVVTLHAFRTTKEAITLCLKQGLDFTGASIWSDNHSRAYEMVSALRSTFFYINCYNVPIDCLQVHINNKTSFVTMDQCYHYESMVGINGVQKCVVFPFGTIFAN